MGDDLSPLDSHLESISYSFSIVLSRRKNMEIRVTNRHPSPLGDSKWVGLCESGNAINR